MLIVSGHLLTTRERRDAYVAGCVDVVSAARNAPGCLDFVIAADPLDPDRVHVYERWASEAELLAFRGDGPSGGQMADIVSAEVERYEVSAAGPA